MELKVTLCILMRFELIVNCVLGHTMCIKIKLLHTQASHLALNTIIFLLLSQGIRVLRSALIRLSLCTRRECAGILTGMEVNQSVTLSHELQCLSGK